MKGLAGRVPVPMTLFLYIFAEETLGSMSMVTAATLVFLFWHCRYKSFCLVKGFLDCGLTNQALQEFLVKFERARLRNLISCVNRYHSWCRINTSDEHLAKASRVTCTQNNYVDIKALSFQSVLKTFFVKLVYQGWKLFVLKAEPAAFLARFLRLKHSVAHHNQHSWIVA